MTEHTVPFSGTAVAEPPAPMLPAGPDDDSADSAGRRKLAIVGAVVGVVVLLVAAFFLLRGGSSSPAASGAVPHGHPAAVPAVGHPAAHKPITLPKSFKGNVGRDPFKPLYVQPSAAPAKPTKPKTPVTTPVTAPVTNPVVTVPGGSNPGASAFAPVYVELVRLHGVKSADFVVGYSDGKHNKTQAFDDVALSSNSPFTAFGGTFALLSIQGHTATVKYGDGQPFDLFAGFGNRHFVG
jgi:hypothetical protein